MDKGMKATGELNLQTLDQHWNSTYMKAVRLKLLAGEEIPNVLCVITNF